MALASKLDAIVSDYEILIQNLTARDIEFDEKFEKIDSKATRANDQLVKCDE